jgi:RimJ/RimL family protein N-acetyltransferase
VPGPEELLTARLRLRRWRPQDEAVMAAINRDAQVTRYLNRAVDPAAVVAFDARVEEHWAEHGFGFWAVELRASARLLGFAGVAYPTFLPELAARPELGWRLASDVWGRGFGGESAAAARDHAFAALGLPELISIIHPDNVRSRRLATGLGMTLERLVHNPLLGRDVEVWQLAAPSGPRLSAA